MNVFQSTLTAKFAEKKEALLHLKKPTTAQEEAKPATLDYSTNKVLRQMKEFEEERQKKKRKAFKDNASME